MIAILEDNEFRIEAFLDFFKDREVYHTKNPNEFIAFVKANVARIELMCLDHDLGFYEYVPYRVEITGHSVCKALVEANLPELQNIQIIIHSANPTGADEMKRTLNKGRIQSDRRWFPWW